MERPALGALSRNSLNSRSSISSTALRSSRPNHAFKATEDRRASAFPGIGHRRSTVNVNPQRPSGPVRKSIALGSSRAGLRQDPRPLTDRSFIQRSVKSLISFLIDRGYDSQLSPKTLHNPTSKDFSSIFLFLLHRIDPTFSFQKKFEEELPAVIKCLGYPFAMSKSSLSAIGSPHSWPPLLGLLMWLVSLISYDELCISKEENGNPDHQARRDSFFRDNMTKAYALWLHGAEEFSGLDLDMQDFFLAESEGRDENIATLQADAESLKGVLQTLQTQPSPLLLGKEHLQTLEANVNKFKLLLPSLAGHLEQVEAKVTELSTEISLETCQLSDLKQERNRLEPILSRQDEDAIDAERMVSDREKLRAALHQSQCERMDEERIQKEVEAKVAEKHRALVSILNEYNRDLEAYDLLGPASGTEGWSGRGELTLSLAGDASITDPAMMLDKDVEKDLLPKIESMKKSFLQGIPSMQEKQLKLHEEVDETEEKVIMLRHEVSVLEGLQMKREAEYEAKKDELQQSLRERSEAIMTRDDERASSMFEIDAEIRDSNRDVDALMAQKHALEKRLGRERAQVRDSMLRDMRVVKEHQQQVGAIVLALKDIVEVAGSETFGAGEGKKG